jgi:hypothetical protein
MDHGPFTSSKRENNQVPKGIKSGYDVIKNRDKKKSTHLSTMRILIPHFRRIFNKIYKNRTLEKGFKIQGPLTFDRGAFV